MSKLKKYALEKFSYDVTDLDSYVGTQREDIFANLVAKSKTASLLTLMDGVKGTEKIKLMAEGAALQSAASCGFTPVGGVILSDVDMVTAPIKINEAYCNEDLVGTWGQAILKAGARNGDDDMPFQDAIIAYYLKLAGARIEKLIWKGDKTSVDTNLLYIDGLIKQFLADATVIDANAGGTFTTIDSTNAMTALIAVVNALPAETIDNEDAAIFVGRETYRAALTQLYNSNNNYKIDEDAGQSFIVPTSNVRVYSSAGLNGTPHIFAGSLSLMFYGTDLSEDSSDIRIRYSDETEKIHVSVVWRSGVGYVFGDKFVKLSPTAS
jgi:hypothetical protein